MTILTAEGVDFEAAKKAAEDKIAAEIRGALGPAVVDLHFDWTHWDEDEATVKVKIVLDKHVSPKDWRDAFFGLTSRVKRTMGDSLLRPVFPELTPTVAA